MNIAESHNVRSMVAKSAQQRKGKAMAEERDLDLEKAKEVKELAESRVQF